MKSATTIDTKRKSTFLFIGTPGSGKTSTALHFPKPFIFDCDDNVTSAIKYTGITAFLHSSPYVDDDGKPVPPVSRYARLAAELNAAAMSPDVETIIIDSLTTLVDILCSEAKRLGGISNDAQMRIQDWGVFGGLMRHLVMSLKASGKIVIFIGHTEVEQDEATKQWFSFVSFPGKARTILPGLFTDVLLFTCQISGFGAGAKTQRIIRTDPENGTDMRGLKDTFRLPSTVPLDEFIKTHIPKLS